ncbi:MAG: RusA family crossover junction endodeoxyribonuclease [Desulfobulbaceae bacterium]|nr:RusA family crossover junction endodeoxyribonuclease [Desulfobulbaceae bacterium]
MNLPITFFVPGEPKALKRHRTFGRVQVDPSKSDKADFLVVSRQHCPECPLTGPLYLHIDFYFPRPKSHYGTGKNSGKLKPTAPLYHIARPDADNLTKFVCDALNGVFWGDDAQIAQVQATKKYVSDVGIGGYIGPGVAVEIGTLHNEGDEFFTLVNKNPV